MKVVIPGKGVLHGTTLRDPESLLSKCSRFSRVPYALPPINERRWQKPQPLPPDFNYGSKDYTRPSPICPQTRIFGQQSPIHNEDCLYCNIWVPLGEPPAGGWPVFFYIHGGFLQYGSNNYDDPSSLLRETDVKCIIVSPAYRLGILGFLASKEISEANFGFWDQRLALEWTFENITHFGGDQHNITVGGLSAGAYSTFHQLAHDIGGNSTRQIIRRVFQWSNGCGVQPKRVVDVQRQFDDLVSLQNIPSSWTNDQKVSALREKTADELLASVSLLKQQFFRPILDGTFMSETLFRDIFSGHFGRKMKELGIHIMTGDLTQEFHLYKNVFPPTSHEDLIDRLSWDYPHYIAEAVCAPYKLLSKTSPSDWPEIFGRLYADMQIHATMRGLVQSLSQQLPLSHIHRYQIDWRTLSVDKRLPSEHGATHGTDMSIWFFGNGDTLTASETVLIKDWLKPLGSFIRGDSIAWGTTSLNQIRCITSRGKIEIRQDELWEEKLKLWNQIKNATRLEPLRVSKL